MSKTYKDLVQFDNSTAKKRKDQATARFKREKLKRKDERRLYAFTTWIEKTAGKDD